MEDELQPQFGDLVDDDEQKAVVAGRLLKGLLRAEQLFELQQLAVALSAFATEIELDAFLEIATMPFVHGFSLSNRVCT